MIRNQEGMEVLLGELKNQIIELAETDRLEAANLLVDQYIKLAPTKVDRYILEALVLGGKGDWEGAVDILKEGAAEHPLDFNILYNLGYVFQQKEEILEAYHLYMKARYVAVTEQESADVGEALKGLTGKIQGTVKLDNGELTTIIMAGKNRLVLSAKMDKLIYRQKLLRHIETYLARGSLSVLDIGFGDGIISKNLNYFGYEVTAVDRVKERILAVVAREWHDNILQSRQRVAKYYHESVDLDWLGKIPEFDIIIAASDNNFGEFAVQEGQVPAILEALLAKAKSQLFITLATESSGSHFRKQDLEAISARNGWRMQTIVDLAEGFQLCVVDKETARECFSVPSDIQIQFSSSTIFEVALNKCVDVFGAAYLNDWHPFVEVLLQYRDNPDLKYEDSVLKQYYSDFQPRNLEEGLFSKRGRASKVNQGWIDYPWMWDVNHRVVFQKNLNETRPGGNHFFGPNTDEFGTAELDRLIPLYTILKTQGYLPEVFSDGYISGYLLVMGEDYRFVVTEGQHRVACLAALGYEKIRVRFTQRMHYPRIVFWHEARKWPQVANGVYKPGLALKIFERFFAEGVGKDRMRL